MEGDIVLAAKLIGAGLAAIGVFGGGIGVGLAALGATQAMGRNPDATGTTTVSGVRQPSCSTTS